MEHTDKKCAFKCYFQKEVCVQRALVEGKQIALVLNYGFIVLLWHGTEYVTTHLYELLKTVQILVIVINGMPIEQGCQPTTHMSCTRIWW